MKTKEEQLKIYSAYLPYGLKGKITDGGKGNYILRAVYDDGSIIWKYDGFGNSRQIGVTPVLYPLDMLTQEIEHEGEIFIPIEKLMKMRSVDPNGFCCDIRKQKAIDALLNDLRISNRIAIDMFNKLLEWHFNVLNLSEDEFINKAILNQKSC